MNVFALASIILTLAILMGYLNHRYIGMQSSIAVMAGALILSLLLVILHQTGISHLADYARTIVRDVNFQSVLLNGMLSFLLFAGALTVDLHLLKSRGLEIAVLASLGTIAATFIVGTTTYYLLPLLHINLPYLYCLLFGAVISPTDPIAVLAVFRRMKAPKSLEMIVSGESLFNDGIAIVIFITLFQLTFNHVPVTLPSIFSLFLKQAGGGIIYGFLLGWLTQHSLKHCKDRNHKIDVFLTLVTVTGGYQLALAMDISGPLAMVVAGIMVGQYLHSDDEAKTSAFVNTFWELIDDLLNAVLFLLIGLELFIIKVTANTAIASCIMIPLVLLARFITVAMPIKLLALWRETQPRLIAILTWGGLRGGLAVALALSLPKNQYRELILTLTYSVVTFSIIVQGLTIKPLLKITCGGQN